jgi:hypothetical protein
MNIIPYTLANTYLKRIAERGCISLNKDYYSTISTVNEGKQLKTFTTTELRLDRRKIFNEVQNNGAVAIAHRDRPLMLLITQKEFDKRVAIGK